MLRTDLSGSPTARQLVRRVRDVVLEADAHQHLPFEKLVEELGPARNLSYTPLFQVMFAFQSVPPAGAEVAGLRLEPLPMVDTHTAKFDLTLTLLEEGERLTGALEYNTDLFDAATVARMVGHLERLLAAMASAPEQPVLDVPLDALPPPPTVRTEPRAVAASIMTPGAGRCAVAPRDPLEVQLVQIWEKVLDVHPIGVTDDFFDLGGHSLLGLRLFSRIRKQIGHDLPVSVLFRGATIENLARVLRRQIDAGPPKALVELRQGSRRPVFFVHPVGGNVMCYVELARHLGADRPFYALQASGRVSEPRIETLAADYIKEIQVVQPAGPYAARRMVLRRDRGVRNGPATRRSGSGRRRSGAD